MRPLLATILLLLTCPGLQAARETPGSALAAIRLLPRGEYKKIARIEAREGTPVPERWHILVHNAKDENGLHEYVISGGELVASRKISQFAEFIKPEEVLKESLVKVDSDKVAALAQQFAFANNVTIAALNYVLKKEGVEAAPLWSVGCLNEQGQEIGRLVVSATKGTVISHEGFTTTPGSEIVAETVAEESRSSSSYSSSRSRSRKPTYVGRPAPPPPPAAPKKEGFFDRVFGGKR